MNCVIQGCVMVVQFSVQYVKDGLKRNKKKYMFCYCHFKQFGLKNRLHKTAPRYFQCQYQQFQANFPPNFRRHDYKGTSRLQLDNFPFQARTVTFNRGKCPWHIQN